MLPRNSSEDRFPSRFISVFSTQDTDTILRVAPLNATFSDLLLQIISYDPTRGGVSVVTEKGDTTTSFLLVQGAKPSDSGRYTCNPSNAQPKSITVHVLNEYPAAMQHGGQAKQPRLYSLLLCLCLLLY
ncbi:hypothetical protein ANTRET_LOCUS3230 [Anthophora retusa]